MRALFFIATTLIFGTCLAQGNFEKKAERTVPALGAVSEVSLKTTYSNQSDMSISDKTSLFLSDYDKKNKLPVLEATGTKSGKDYVPYIAAKCDGGSCGIAPAPAGITLSTVTLDKAKEALKGKTSATAVDKTKFKDGSVWIVQSEAPDKTTGKKWAVTVAVELQKFAANAKDVTVKYKVLEFAQK